MTTNILVNPLMEIDDLHEGAIVPCRNGPGESTEGPLRWFAQLDAKDAEVSLARIVGPSTSGSFSYSRLTVLEPASVVAGLDRLQLFQPIENDELYGLTVDHESDSIAQELEMSFGIRTNIDIDVGCTLNSGLANRNFTTNRHVEAGSWHSIRVLLPRDPVAPWLSDARFGMYFQIGLSCGATRLSNVDGRWNDGHSLMIETPYSSKFLMTKGAQADITKCYFGPALGVAMAREPTMLTRARTQRFVEKSYFVGTAPGTSGQPDGAFEIRTNGSQVLDRIHFQSLKLRSYRPHLYSPLTGLLGKAYDVTAACDVPAIVVEQAPNSMTVSVPNGLQGHVYQVHWMVHDFE